MCSSPKSSGAKPKKTPMKGIFSSFSSNAQANFTRRANLADEKRQMMREIKVIPQEKRPDQTNIPSSKNTKVTSKRFWLLQLLEKDLLSLFSH